jgi:hypothetical protein
MRTGKAAEVRPKNAEFQNDPVEQINLDLHFLQAMVDCLQRMGMTEGEIPIKGSTVAAMCFEMRSKLDNIDRFIDALPASAR